MDLLLCWLIAPVGLLAVAVGLSLGIERLTGLRLPWTLRPALGLAAAIVVAQFFTATDATAELAVWAILLLAVAGLLAGVELVAPRPGRAEVFTGIVVFALFAAPFVIIGEATWAGYIKLDDTATWMALTDHSFEFGRGVGSLAPSTHQATIEAYLGGSYPIGGFVAAKLMSTISGQDVAFTFQPSMAFGAACLALVVLELARAVVRRTRWAVAVAVLSSLATITIGYYLWGGVKELIAAALLALGPALGGVATAAGWPRRAAIVLAVAIVGLIAVLGPGGGVWVVATLVPVLVELARRAGWARAWQLAWPTALGALVLALPVLVTPDGLFDPLDSSLTEATELGNLSGPLNLFHIAGIWPALDFRSGAELEPLVIGTAIVCLALAVGTVVACARFADRRGVPFAAYAGGGAVGAAAIMILGSPWVDGKAMATIAPALLAAALLGIVLLAERTPFRFEAAALGAVVALLVAWSAFLAYQGVWFAPREQSEELADIGEEFSGQGPALTNEVASYGARHFLRELDPEGATDLRRRQVLLTGGRSSADGEYVDLDQIQTDQLDPYNVLVIPRSPSASRPPAEFALAKSTPHYEVWRRSSPPGPRVGHLALGDSLDAAAEPSCGEVADLAAAAGPTGTLVAAPAGRVVTVDVGQASVPRGWGVANEYTVIPRSSGTMATQLALDRGTYEVWLGGAVFGSATVRVDGREVASERAQIDNAGDLEPLGSVTVDGGTHSIELEYSSGGLMPGSAVDSFGVGPLSFAVAPDREDLVRIGADDYKRLCGQRWDWIEAYAG